jgi:cellobiose transport system permease protein
MNRKPQPELRILLGPIIAVFILFSVIPFAVSLVFSLFKTSGNGLVNFVGFQNYGILATDSNFTRGAIATTLVFLLSAVPQSLIALILAFILNSTYLRFKGFFRAVIFMPYISGGIALSIVFINIFSAHPSFGAANYLLHSIGLEPLNWQGNVDTLFFVIGVMMNWRYIGWNMILYLASLSSIPASVFEAADMDGAGSLMKLRVITLPHMIPILLFTFTINTINAIQEFDGPFIFSGGTLEAWSGPQGLGRPLSVYIIWLLRKAGRLDKASAVAWVLFLVILALTFVNRFVVRRLDKE